MRTSDLINVLCVDPRPHRFSSSFSVICLGVLLSSAVVVVIAFAWLGARSDLVQIVMEGDYTFFIRFTFIISVMGTALICLRDLAVPGRRVRLPSVVALLPFILMGILGFLELIAASFEESPRQAAREPWLRCLSQIAALSVPAFTIITLALRRLAPTDLRRTGLYIGLFAGGIGAMAYVLCADGHSISFSSLAYTGAIWASAALGLILGPRILRWT